MCRIGFVSHHEDVSQRWTNENPQKAHQRTCIHDIRVCNGEDGYTDNSCSKSTNTISREGVWSVPEAEPAAKVDVATLPPAGKSSQVCSVSGGLLACISTPLTHIPPQLINAVPNNKETIRRLNSTAKRMQASSVFAVAQPAVGKHSGKKRTPTGKVHQSGSWQPGWGAAAAQTDTSITETASSSSFAVPSPPSTNQGAHHHILPTITKLRYACGRA